MDCVGFWGSRIRWVSTSTAHMEIVGLKVSEHAMIASSASVEFKVSWFYSLGNWGKFQSPQWTWKWRKKGV